MTDATDAYEDDYAEFDEFDEDEEAAGLSGLAVLLMGVLILGAFVAVTYTAYRHGINTAQTAGTPYVAADPEPIKIESAQTSTQVEDRELYDVFDGEDAEPVTVLAEGPEEPVNRDVEDTIGALATEAGESAEDIYAEVNERLASLQAEDASIFEEETADEPEPASVTPPTPASTKPANTASGTRPSVTIANQKNALDGSHVVQVGAFRSDQEAQVQWARIQSRLGDFVASKAIDVERADLGDRGVYHRLRIGPFANAAAAKEFCAGLKERGQDCLIKGV